MANLIISLANQIEVSYCYECSSDIFICSVCICYAVIPLSAVWFDMDKKKVKYTKSVSTNKTIVICLSAILSFTCF